MLVETSLGLSFSFTIPNVPSGYTLYRKPCWIDFLKVVINTLQLTRIVLV